MKKTFVAAAVASVLSTSAFADSMATGATVEGMLMTTEESKGLDLSLPDLGEIEFKDRVKVAGGGSLTQGVGGEVSFKVNQHIDLRAFMYRASLSETQDIDGITYAADLKVENPGLVVDFYPSEGRSFKITAGAIKNGNKFTATATPAGSYDIDGTTYTAAQVGSLETAVDFKSYAPYVGVGYDLNLAGGLGLNFEAGAYNQGSPNVSMTADGTLAMDPGFMADLEAQRAAAEDSLSDLEWMPVAKITLSYRF